MKLRGLILLFLCGLFACDDSSDAADATVSDAPPSDRGFTDAPAADAPAADAPAADAPAPDAPAPDAFVDAGEPDAPAPDAIAADADLDAGFLDAEEIDAGPPILPLGAPCDPTDPSVMCTAPSVCTAYDAKSPSNGRCFFSCDFTADPICPIGSRCNDRAGSLGGCVQTLPLGAICDDMTYPPTNLCAPPNICVRPAANAICTAPTYTESVIANPSFIDACTLGTVVALTDLDDGNSTAPLMLPFAFTFFGMPFTEVWPSTNGYATLGIGPSNATFGPPAISEGMAVGPFWTDLAMDNPGARICAAAISNTNYVIQWQNAYRRNRPNMDLDFELILNAGTNTIDFVYQTLTPTTGADAPFAAGLDAHIGVQNAGATDFTIHDGRVTTAQGLRFTP